MGQENDILRSLAAAVASLKAAQRGQQTNPTEVLNALQRLCEALKSAKIPEWELVKLWERKRISGFWDLRKRIPGPLGWSKGVVRREECVATEEYVALTARGPIRLLVDRYHVVWLKDSYVEINLRPRDLEDPAILNALLEALKNLPENLRRMAEELIEQEAKKHRIIDIAEKFIMALKEV